MSSTIFRLAISAAVFITVKNVRMSTTIQSYNDTTTEMQIECIVDREWNYDGFDFLEITKGNDRVAAVIPGMELDKGSRDNMEVIGHVDNDKRGGQLKVMIHNPSELDTGKYDCRKHFRFTMFHVVHSNISVHDSPLTMNTEFKHKDGKADIQLKVTCTVDPIENQNIETIKITKQGQEGPIAIILRARKRRPRKGPSAPNDARVRGAIRDQSDEKSYLTMIINEPSSIRDSGLYKCVVFTEPFNLFKWTSRKEIASTDVDIQYEGNADMMQDVKRMMSIFMKTVRDVVSKQKKTIQKLRQQSKDIEELKQFVKKEKKRIDERQQQSNTEEDTKSDTPTTTTPTTTMTTVSTTTFTTTPETTTTSTPTSATPPKTTTTATQRVS